MLLETIPMPYEAMVRTYVDLKELNVLLSKILGGHSSQKQFVRTDYEVRCEQDRPPHQYGLGGEYEHRVVLSKCGTPILLSVDYCSYDTSQDDSEDYTNRHSKKTYLLKKYSIAQRIFGSLCAHI